MNRATIFLPLLLFFLTTACAAAPTPTLATPRPSASSSATPSAGPSSPTAPALATPASNRQAPMGTGDLPAPVLAFTGDPHDPRSAYALLSNYDLFYTHDRGLTWQALPFPPAGTGEDFHSIGQPYPLAGPDLVANTFQPGLLFARAGNSLYRSRDAAQNWEDISKGLPSRFGFPMAIHPHEPQTIYVVPEISPEYRYVCDGKLAVYRSRNGGETWQRLTRGLPQKHVYTQVLRHATTTDVCNDAGVYLGTTGGEIFFSRNAGDSWELLRAHLPPVLSLEAAVV